MKTRSEKKVPKTHSFREDFVLRLQIHAAAMRCTESEFIEYCVNYFLNSPDVKTTAALLEAIGRDKAGAPRPQTEPERPTPKYPSKRARNSAPKNQ